MIAGLILAGGEARRLGGVDKPLLMLGGRPMLSRILAMLAPDIAALAISANGDPRRYAAFGLPVLPDGEFRGQGPLAGLLAGLDWAATGGAEALLTVPGDTPFIPHGLAGALAPAPACAASRGREHHLVALWPVGQREMLRALLRGPGSRGVARYAERIGRRVVPFPDEGGDPFMNVNTADDLARAAARAGKS